MLIELAVYFVPIILAIVLHEVAHGYAAYWCGDDTAKQYKRLSLNPLRHVDIFGTLILPTLLLLSKTGFIFGWAKPVPVNFNNLRRPKTDTLIVAAAGILMNLFLALLSAILLRLLPSSESSIALGIIKLALVNFVVFNVVLAVFNILPVPPLDGSKILLGWSANPQIRRFWDSYRQGTMFIILVAFVVPLISRYFGYDFNPFGWYMIKASRWIVGLFI